MSFSSRRAAQFVEDVGQHGHVNRAPLPAGFRSRGNHEAPAIGRQVQVPKSGKGEFEKLVETSAPRGTLPRGLL